MQYLQKALLAGLILGFFIVQSCTQRAEEPSAVEATPTAQKPNPMVKSVVQQKPQKKVANSDSGEGLNWLSFENLEQTASSDKKKVLVDVYTDWCGWCKVMDKKTFANAEVQAYLNENFHVVKFNAEQKSPILYRGKEYNWRAGGRRGVNTLAVELLNGRLGYPTLVYLDEDLNKIGVSPGYKTPEKLLAELRNL